MTIPDFHTPILPLLKLLGDRFGNAVEALADELGLSQDERDQVQIRWLELDLNPAPGKKFFRTP